VRSALRVGEAALDGSAPVTWDEAELLEVSRTSARGTADAEALGVHPRSMPEVLGIPRTSPSPPPVSV
jgi:NADH dehydrogenase